MNHQTTGQKRPLVDLHCDTISRLQKQQGTTLWDNELQIAVPQLQEAGTLAQFFACFVNVTEYEEENRWNQAYDAVHGMIDRAEKEISGSKEIKLAGSFSDIWENRKQNIISALLTVEEGGVLNSDMSRLERLYQRGIRLITLTWNYENCLGFPNSRDRAGMEKGLKVFGVDVVKRMNELGMIVDVSHLSDAGFWDCIQYSKSPIVASHSNARQLCSHQRNLSDEMLKALGEKGGVAGINFYPTFLEKDGQSTLESIARHAAYMIDKAGEDAVAIGTDLDGYMPVQGAIDIRKAGKMPCVIPYLERVGLTERQIDKVWSENALRVIEEICVS